MSSKTPKNPLTPEWPHKVEVDRLGTDPTRIALSSTPQQRRDLARRLKVNVIDALDAELLLQRRANSQLIHVTGIVKADIVQSCIVTLEPVRSQIEEKFESWYSDEDQVVSLPRVRREQQGMRADAELEILGDEEDPEPVVEGAIDVGELAAQHLALAIDLYPRSEAVRNADEGEEAVFTAGERPNPFAALKDWKAGRKKDD